MRTVNTIRRIVEFQTVTKEEFFKTINRRDLYFGLVHNDTDRPHRLLCTFNSAVEMAKDRLVVSDHFWLETNVSGFLVFNPKTGEYKMRTETKKKVSVEVSEDTYNDCLRDIQDQLSHDRLYGWRPKDPNYYDIENWTFDVDGQLH